MMYENLVPLKIYTLPKLILPKGERSGFGNALFLLSSSQITSLENLNSDYFNYRAYMYKYYYIDGYYKEKIGFKKIVKNDKHNTREAFKNNPLPSLKIVDISNKMTLLKKRPNIIVDLGQWLELYFTYHRLVSLNSICDNFITFLSNKINDEAFSNYDKKILYLDVDMWYKNKVLKLKKDYLKDPLSIIMMTLYKFPELLYKLGNIDIIITDSETKQFMFFNTKEISKNFYNKFKSRLRNFSKLENLEDDGDTQNDPILSKISKEKENEIKNKRTLIINSLKKNFVGEVDDLTEYIEDDMDLPDNDIIKTDSDYDEDIEIEANRYMDENPDILTGNMDDAIKEVETFVKKKVYISKFTPERTEKEKKKMEELSKTQNQILKSKYSDLESKMIPESDFSDFVLSNNYDILTSKFANFDKAYAEKKLMKAIDDSVGMLSNADFPVYVVDKTEEDTSDTLNLKKTLTYNLEDINGRKMSVKFDIPVVIDGKYIYINGAKKVIGHQMILKPLVKTNHDTCQIVSTYNKVFITRKGDMDISTFILKKYILANSDKFKVKLGNTTIKNTKYNTSIEFDAISKNIYQFVVHDIIFITEIEVLINKLKEKGINYKEKDGVIPIGYNKKSKEVITMKENESYVNKITSFFNDNEIEELRKTKSSKNFMYVECKVLQKFIPIVLFMAFCEGLTSVMEKAKIEYRFIQKDELNTIDTLDYGTTELEDGYLVWKRYPLKNSLIMNGLQKLPMHLYSHEELDSKETYIFLLSQFYSYANMAFNLDQYKDFLIDPITKEILEVLNLPTDLVSLMIYACELLEDNHYLPENNYNNTRLRGAEIIALHVNNAIIDAYNLYRKSQHKKNPTKISIKQNQIIANTLKSKLVEDASILNPVMELEKGRSITYKGEKGINLDDAMTVSKRAYDESMLGVAGISTPADANVGIMRQLTLEPNITSTLGLISTTSKKDVDKLSAAQLLTPAELITPFGLQHDDPTRTAMTYKQSKFMIPVADSSPVLIGNKVESIVPYHTSDEFSVVAEMNGKVVDIQDGIVVVQYSNGSYKSIDTNIQVKKNSSAGFFIETQLVCDKKIGDRVKKGEVIAYDAKTYTKNKHDLSASMNLGVLTKVAVAPSWDIYEDSLPVTESLSERLSTVMIDEKMIALDKNTFIQKIVKIGDKVRTGDPLIVFDENYDDPFVARFLESIREDMREEVIESNITTIKSKKSGEIVDIKIYSTVDMEELHPSIQDILKEYHKRINKKVKVLNKYQNAGDMKYYKSGNIINESTDKLIPNAQGKIKGQTVNEGVLIIFYIKFKDKISKGDKIVHQSALKGVASHVIEKGYEPYSEYRPDEEISSIIAPLSITARKTPSIFLSMFGNKLLIELKRQLKEMYLGENE